MLLVLATIVKLYNCLLNENNEIFVDEIIQQKARKSIVKMLELSATFNL